MKDSDFLVVVLILVAIFFHNEIKEGVKKRLFPEQEKNVAKLDFVPSLHLARPIGEPFGTSFSGTLGQYGTSRAAEMIKNLSEKKTLTETPTPSLLNTGDKPSLLLDPSKSLLTPEMGKYPFLFSPEKKNPLLLAPEKENPLLKIPSAPGLPLPDPYFSEPCCGATSPKVESLFDRLHQGEPIEKPSLKEKSVLPPNTTRLGSGTVVDTSLLKLKLTADDEELINLDSIK